MSMPGSTAEACAMVLAMQKFLRTSIQIQFNLIRKLEEPDEKQKNSQKWDPNEKSLLLNDLKLVLGYLIQCSDYNKVAIEKLEPKDGDLLKLSEFNLVDKSKPGNEGRECPKPRADLPLVDSKPAATQRQPDRLAQKKIWGVSENRKRMNNDSTTIQAPSNEARITASSLKQDPMEAPDVEIVSASVNLFGETFTCSPVTNRDLMADSKRIGQLSLKGGCPKSGVVSATPSSRSESSNASVGMSRIDDSVNAECIGRPVQYPLASQLPTPAGVLTESVHEISLKIQGIEPSGKGNPVSEDENKNLNGQLTAKPRVALRKVAHAARRKFHGATPSESVIPIPKNFSVENSSHTDQRWIGTTKIINIRKPHEECYSRDREPMEKWEITRSSVSAKSSFYITRNTIVENKENIGNHNNDISPMPQLGAEEVDHRGGCRGDTKIGLLHGRPIRDLRDSRKLPPSKKIECGNIRVGSNLQPAFRTVRLRDEASSASVGRRRKRGRILTLRSPSSKSSRVTRCWVPNDNNRTSDLVEYMLRDQYGNTQELKRSYERRLDVVIVDAFWDHLRDNCVSVLIHRRDQATFEKNLDRLNFSYVLPTYPEHAVSDRLAWLRRRGKTVNTEVADWCRQQTLEIESGHRR